MKELFNSFMSYFKNSNNVKKVMIVMLCFILFRLLMGIVNAGLHLAILAIMGCFILGLGGIGPCKQIIPNFIKKMV